MTDLSCITWNVHRGRGKDGRVDPDRIRQTLVREVCPPGSAEVLSLQEADGETPPHAGFLDITRIEAETGLRAIHTEARLRWGSKSDGFLGVLLFLSPAVDLISADVVDLPGHCHRGAVVAEVLVEGRSLRIVATHLSLSQPLRIAQMRTLGQNLYRRPDSPTILMGDLNEWRPWAGLAFSHSITGMRLSGQSRATFPVSRPFLPLDRILVSPSLSILETRAMDGPGIRVASDHRPLIARLSLAG